MNQFAQTVDALSNEEVLAFVEAKLSACATDVPSLVELGQALEAREAWPLAAAAYGAAAQLSGLDGERHFQQGLMHERDGAFVAASEAYGRAVAAPIRSTKHWYFLGRSQERAGHHQAAAEAYRTYVARSEADGEPFTRRLGGLLTFEKQIVYGTMAKPAYAYAAYRSALLAQALGIRRISVIELGVAGGRGLLSLEAIARIVRRLTGVAIQVYGLDTGAGLFRPRDYRDLPHFFAAGDYPMDVAVLTERLEEAELLLGDASETISSVTGNQLSPVGALLFDMDTYSSTAAVLQALDVTRNLAGFLPRVSLYFDDIVPKRSKEWLKDYHDRAGEALAITEFNDVDPALQILPDRYFATPPVAEPWHRCMHLLHAFRHPRYSQHLGVSNPAGLALPSMLSTGVQRPPPSSAHSADEAQAQTASRTPDQQAPEEMDSGGPG